MRGQDVGEFRLILNKPFAILAGIGAQPVHTRHDHTRVILREDRVADGCRPQIGRIAIRGFAEAVALVTEVPRGDGGLIFQVANETASQTDLPH